MIANKQNGTNKGGEFFFPQQRSHGKDRTFRSSRFGAIVAVGAICVLSLGMLSGCGAGDDNPRRNTARRVNPLSSLFRTTVNVRDPNSPTTAYNCWIASRPGQRDEALSYVTAPEVPAGGGMILVYPGNRPLAFAGSKTRLDVDVVYAEGIGNGVGRITDINTISAFQPTPVSASKPVQYVLFVPQGELARSNPKVGDLIYVPVVIPNE